MGDEIVIRGRGRLPSLSMVIRGDIAEGDRLDGVAVVKLDYLQDVVGTAGRVTFIQVRAESAELAPFVSDAIDERFANFSVPTETLTERAHMAGFVAGLSDAMVGLRSIGYLALVITLLVVANSVAIGVRERTREIGTLRALGFGSRRVVGLVLAEAMLVSLVGGVFGAAAAFALFSTGVVAIPGTPLQFVTSGALVTQAALLALPLGALAGAQPAWSAVRMTITDALRYSE